MVQEHNAAAAAVWGRAGGAYDFISFGLSDALSHAVQALWPKPGEHILDAATGTGWTARLVAGLGAKVSAVDIADDLLNAARQLSNGHDITYSHGDAEALPFEDARFDGVISTYGIMFAGNQKQAAKELARVTKPGGRVVLTTWYPGSDEYIPKFFQMIGAFSDAPAPAESPMNWGNADWVQSTMGDDFDLATTPLKTILFAPDIDDLWQKYLDGFGPIRMIADRMNERRLAEFRQAFLDLHAPYQSPFGLTIERTALLIKGIRHSAG